MIFATHRSVKGFSLWPPFLSSFPPAERFVESVIVHTYSHLLKQISATQALCDV